MKLHEAPEGTFGHYNKYYINTAFSTYLLLKQCSADKLDSYSLASVTIESLL